MTDMFLYILKIIGVDFRPSGGLPGRPLGANMLPQSITFRMHKMAPEVFLQGAALGTRRHHVYLSPPAPWQRPHHDFDHPHNERHSHHDNARSTHPHSNTPTPHHGDKTTTYPLGPFRYSWGVNTLVTSSSPSTTSTSHLQRPKDPPRRPLDQRPTRQHIHNSPRRRDHDLPAGALSDSSQTTMPGAPNISSNR